MLQSSINHTFFLCSAFRRRVQQPGPQQQQPRDAPPRHGAAGRGGGGRAEGHVVRPEVAADGDVTVLQRRDHRPLHLRRQPQHQPVAAQQVSTFVVIIIFCSISF